ncbi:hypothetical protein GGI07_003040 [Coemansia sp. Benny D115]|nr:hypothetical protein GGI07_003040 [Coemansia sp. Benny D115]
MSSSDTGYPYEEGQYTIYTCEVCPYTMRALCGFDLANVPVKIIYIDLFNKPAWYKLVNPQLKFPSLRTPDGTILTESLVISEYIADKYPEAQLLPTNPIERAQLRLFVEIFLSRIIPHNFGLLAAATKEEQEAKKVLLLKGIKEASDELLRQWERPGGKGGNFWRGDKFSLAEANVTPFVNQLLASEHWRGFTVPQTEEYSAFNKWVKTYSAHPTYVKFAKSKEVISQVLKRFMPEGN